MYEVGQYSHQIKVWWNTLTLITFNKLGTIVEFLFKHFCPTTLGRKPIRNWFIIFNHDIALVKIILKRQHKE